MPALRTRAAIEVLAYSSPAITPPAPPATPATTVDAAADKAAARQLRARRKALDKDIKRLERKWKKSKTVDAGLALGTAYTERAAVAAKANKADRLSAKALAVYAKLAKDTSAESDPRYDEVLFTYGYHLQSAGKPKQARTLFHRLIKNYPNSVHVPGAYLAFADYFFDANEMDNALRFYDKVMQFPKSDVYNYALYKKGWVYINLGKSQDALEAFYEVTSRTRGSTTTADANLLRSAKKDFVRAYADVGKPTKAFVAFERVDKASAFEMLGHLADIYASQGQWANVVYTRRDQIQREPTHAHVCRFQLGVVDAMVNLGKVSDTVDELGNLAKLYAAHADKNVLPADELAYCGARTEQLLAQTARTMHREAVKTLDTNGQRFTAAVYETYLDTFPTGPEAERSAYYRADLLWRIAAGETEPRPAQKRWHDAAEAFAVYAMTRARAFEHAEAISAALAAYSNTIAIADAAGTRAAPLGKEAATLGNWVISTHPSHPDAELARSLARAAP